MTDAVATSETILVVGGGISGMTAALEAAECCKQVILVEKGPSLGGRVAQLYKYFPKLCRPSCGQEINQRRLQANRNIRLLTLAQVENISGVAGAYSARVRLRPRYVNENCTACGACADAVTSEVDNPFDYGMSRIKAAYLPHNMAYPQRYLLDPSIIGSSEAQAAKDACRYNAIDLNMIEKVIEFDIGAVIFATGWQPYAAERIQPYGYGRYRNVVTSVEFERMMDPFGPTGGKLLRPSDGEEARNIAFIQCAGSRDRNHLSHCSRICCMASLKQSTYIGERYGDDSNAVATIYYIDIRSIDRFEGFYRMVQADQKVKFVKSKVAQIKQDQGTSDLVLHGVDTEGYHRYANRHDLVVLAIGMQPSLDMQTVSPGVALDRSGFIELQPENGALFGAGCASNALDVNRAVQSATAAAMRAVKAVNTVARPEAA